MAQSDDPLGNSTGGPGYNLPPELNSIPFEYWFEDNNDDADQTTDVDRLVWIYVRARAANGQRSRAIRSIIEGNKPLDALNYALFGNAIHFDNHNKTAFGVSFTICLAFMT